MRDNDAQYWVGRGSDAEEVERLLAGNARWAEERLREDPTAFDRLARGQRPPFLFIGCCDSRKPLDTITGTSPGELFIHRNIANLVTPGDVASEAVLDFAVRVLEVRHLIVCGHTRCGGMAAALSGLSDGVLGRWLGPVRQLADQYDGELSALVDPLAREDRLAALNVVAQLENALRNPSVSERLRTDGPPLHLHGWLFHVESGRLESLRLPVQRWRQEGIVPTESSDD